MTWRDPASPLCQPSSQYVVEYTRTRVRIRMRRRGQRQIRHCMLVRRGVHFWLPGNEVSGMRGLDADEIVVEFVHLWLAARDPDLAGRAIQHGEKGSECDAV